MTSFNEITPYLNNPPHPYFTGLVASGSGVGGRVVQLGDRWYLLDMGIDRYRITTIEAFKPQQDQTQRPGQQTLSNSGLWRRIISSWHMGAGQIWYDRDDADPFRFLSSRSMDVFDRWEIKLLRETDTVTTHTAGFTSSAIGELTAGRTLALGTPDGTVVLVDETGTVTTIDTFTGRTWVTSTGSDIYVADDGGIHVIDADGVNFTGFNTNVELQGAKIWYAKDRLIAAVANEIFDVVDGTGNTPHYTHNWTDFEWTSVSAEGEFIYAAGFAGDQGLVYSVGIAEDATDLLPPVVALSLPHGETPLSVQGYVGFIALGTTRGLRICQAEGRGLVMGSLVGFNDADLTEHAVRCLEGQGEFIWFGQDDLFADASGLGRVDLTRFVEPLAPAYASDLLGTQVGDVTTVTTLEGQRYFTVADTLYTEGDGSATSGYLETGRVTMNIIDPKVGVFVDIRHEALRSAEKVEVRLMRPDLPYELIGISNTTNTSRPVDVFSMNHSRNLWHQIRVDLFAGQQDMTPRLTAVELAAQPVPERSFEVILPIIMAESIQYADQTFLMDLNDEFEFLTELTRSQRLIRFRQGVLSYLVFVEDFEWIPMKVSQDEQKLQGTLVLRMKTAEVER